GGEASLLRNDDEGYNFDLIHILMAREGADISIVFLPSEQVSAETTKRLVEKENIQCLLIPRELRDLNFCREAEGKHVAKLSEVNVLVNNASKQYMCKEFSEINLEKIQDVFKTNIIQMVALAKLAVSRRLLRPTYASLMVVIRSYTQRRTKNTSSVVTFRGSGTILDYAVTKGAIIRFTRSLGAHLIPKDIRVNTVAPGALYTPIQVDTREARQIEGWGSKAGLGQRSKVATSFVFLASADASLYCRPAGSALLSHSGTRDLTSTLVYYSIEQI
ncbi:uncharacterized protein N7458_010324, partial [Penicillium daleae]